MRTGLMSGKRGLVMGVANDHSIAWGIAKALAAEGAGLAFTYQNDALGKRVAPLAAKLGAADHVYRCDVEDPASVETMFSALRSAWSSLDFLVHCIGFSDRNELRGRYADTTRENFTRTMVISAFSFTEIAKRAATLMPSGARCSRSPSGVRRVSCRTTMSWGSQRPRWKQACESGRRLRPREHSRQRDFRRTGPHFGGRRDCRCAFHVQFSARPFPAPPHGHDRECRRRRPLSALGSLCRGDR